MKNITFTLLFIFSTLVTPPAIYANELSIKFHSQHTPVWCWAATIAMVTEYMYNEPIEDCEVLSAYDLSLGGQGACCLGDQRCIRTGSTEEMEHIMGNIFNLSGNFIPYPPTYKEIMKSIDNNHPIIAQLRTNRSGHVVVISGYEKPNNVIVLDPMQGRVIVNYNTLRANYTYGTWVSSFLITGKKEPKPAPMPIIASFCSTNVGNCPMQVAIPVGSACSCYTPWGVAAGIAK